MNFNETHLPGLFTIELNKREDERGFFARLFCQNELKEKGVHANIAQINNSFTKQKHTLRGMHYQLPPKAEDRIIRVLKGAIYDVSLDLRFNTPTFGEHFGVELSAENRTMVFIPKGFAHGFMTLEENTEIMYLVTEFYSPEHERVIRWDDPVFSIKWPKKPVHISEKDKKATNFDMETHIRSKVLTK